MVAIDEVGEALGYILPVACTLFLLTMWIVASGRHRAHLVQCDAWRVRLLRLNRRLRGCVTDLESHLERCHLPHSGMIPESLVGHHRYLYGIRQECRDLASEVGRHAARLRWPDGYLNRATLAGRRCDTAHDGLRDASEALALAAREYERMFGVALLGAPGGAAAPPTGSLGPLCFLDQGTAAELTALRDAFAEGVRTVSDVLKPGDRRNNTLDGSWPIYRSELDRTDPYQGEIRPMAWTGLGDQPLTHIDAS